MAFSDNQRIKIEKLEEKLCLTNFQFKVSQDYILFLDEQGYLIYVNESSTKRLGYPRNKLLQMNIVDIEIGLTSMKWQQRFRQLQQKGSLLFECTHQTANGQILPVEVLLNPLEFQGQTLSCAIVRDISDRQEMIAQLEQAKQEAELANDSKSKFLANLAHELRTPLNSVLGFTRLLERSNGLTSQQNQYVEIINRNSEHLLELINDILEVFKVEAGRAKLREHTFDLDHLLDVIETMFRLRAESKGLNLLVKRSSKLPQYVKSDDAKLRQVLINLLNNAVKFTYFGSIILEVKNTEQHPERISFKVSDTGPGISLEEQQRLFAPFVQAAAGEESQQGTGLGLTISREFVRLMGGELTINSELGQGSCFQFCCNLPTASKPPMVTNINEYQTVKSLADGQDYRILVVEDSPDNRMLMVHLLSQVGFEVKEAKNGVEAVGITQNWQPHLIWMDIRMPILNGDEATQQIRSHQSVSKTPPIILALTANAREKQQHYFEQCGFDDYVIKPFQENVLFEKMHQHLGVNYIYEESTQSWNLSQSLKTPSVKPDDLSNLPINLLKELENAATLGDPIETQAVLLQFPDSHQWIAQQLLKQVDDFRLDKISELVELVLSSDKQ